MIFTFYSYKGGVGRSMALANVAECLYQRGARVLIVDWDLEAPGLEHFFYSSDDSQIEKVRSHLGVIDMLLDYQRQCSLASLSAAKPTLSEKQPGGVFQLVKPHLLPLESYLFPIHPPESKTDRRAKGLWLLPAGWRSTGKPRGEVEDKKDERFSRYAQAVQSFDWADLYASFEGQAYFEWLREQFHPSPPSSASDDSFAPLGFDAVLIDSRTGVTEMGGVCTRQLADVVVSFCASNYQNLDGVLRMTRSFLRKEIEEFRGGKKLEVVVVPSRIDLASETSLQNRLRAQFGDQFKTPDIFQRLNLKMWDLCIPYIVRHAYYEALAIGDPDANTTLADAYWRLASRLVLFSEKDSRLREFFAAELRQLTRLVPEAAIEATSAVEEVALQASSMLAGFTSEEQAAARRILTRLVRVTSEPSGDTRLRVKLNELKVVDEPVLSKLVGAGILKTQTDNPGREQTVELVHDVLLHQWPALSDWLNQDREFLLWRLRLNAGISTWEQKGRDSDFLLHGKGLDEARRWTTERPSDLNVIEHTFIGASVQRRRQIKFVAVKAVSVLALSIIGWSVWTHYNRYLSGQLSIVVPEYQKPSEQLVHLEQGWTDDQQLHFHHTPQGTRLVPYAWFMALEQPCFSLFGCEMFADKTYLARFGFLDSNVDAKLNPDGLPIGFARQEDFYDPESQKTYPVVGLTCATCHTGELHYGKYAVRIEGAPAMIEVTQFQKALGLSLGFTKLIPFRYGRFEKRVLGANASESQKADLKKEFNAFLDSAEFELDNTKPGKGIYDNPAGFDRTDALTRIGNQMFAVDMKNAANFAPANAPVRFPQIWEASWFSWMQYNSSISDPLVRNVSELFCVRADAKLYGPDAKDFGNSINMEGIRAVEELLSGPAPYRGLRPPKWPSVFPSLDERQVARGAQLYQENCQQCHLPPAEELTADLISPKPTYWQENSQGKRFLRLKDVPAGYVGTDPREATDFLNRRADTGDLGKGRVSAGDGLDLVTNGIINTFFNKMGLSTQQDIQWRGNRDPHDDPAVRSVPVYKARPLTGIWAVSPYLHNGSVPNLYALLSPQGERPDQFWTGSMQFDPVKVGHDTSEIKGGYLYDVAKTGNSNHGHEFKDGPKGNGVIGPALSPADRWAIIEYLKSL